MRIVPNANLPKPTAEMHDAILTAVQSGKLEDLKVALELNEMRPDLSGERVDDPIAFLKTQSKDGQGADILAVLGKVLEGPAAAIPLGRDIENNAIYVWPALAERDLGQLSADDGKALEALMGVEEAQKLKQLKRWTWWRVAIGADGTWHSFRKEK